MKTISIILLLTLAVSSLQAQRIKGSDTVLPVAQQTAERFMALNPDARVTVTGGGTGVGISALLDGTTDIAMASRPIKDVYKRQGLHTVRLTPFTVTEPLSTVIYPRLAISLSKVYRKVK